MEDYNKIKIIISDIDGFGQMAQFIKALIIWSLKNFLYLMV